MKLPLFISVPHAGTNIPAEVNGLCLLSRDEILAEHDAGSDTIYCTLEEHVADFCTTDIARSLVDLNRAPDDIGGNGVIKSHTCRNVPVYSSFPNDDLIRQLLARYYMPYHKKLSLGATDKTIRLGIDCHTMSQVGPPVSPDPGQERFFFDLLFDCLTKGTLPLSFVLAEIQAGRMRADGLEELKRSGFFTGNLERMAEQDMLAEFGISAAELEHDP